MAIEKENIDTLFDRIERFEEQKRNLSEDIKDAFSLFAEQNDVKAKSLKKAYKAYKEHKKNKEEFALVDAEASQIIDLAITEEETTEETE